MFLKIIKPVSVLLFVIVLTYVLHQVLFTFLKIDDTTFKYSLAQLYFFFGGFTLIIEIIVNRVKQKNIDLVGNVFLALTLIKMMFCFILGNAISNSESLISVQKNNFLLLFFIFLTIETVSTIKLLNKK